MPLYSSVASPVEVGAAPRPGVLLKTVVKLYHAQFKRWFAITAPTSLVAAAVLFLADHRVKAIFRSIRLFEIPNHWNEVAEATTFRFGSYFLTWLLGCFALGAIATVVSGFDHEDSDGVWRPDSHQRTRDHFGGVVLVALITFCALLIGMGRLEMVETAAIRVVGWSQFSQYNYAAAVLGTVVVASVVSWLGMAVPLTLRGNTGVWGALRRSIELSNGYEGVPVRVGRADSGRFLFRLVSDSLCPETLVA